MVDVDSLRPLRVPHCHRGGPRHESRVRVPGGTVGASRGGAVTLFNWPRSQTQIYLWYNTMMFAVTSAGAYFVRPWLVYVTASFWSLFFVWDLYVRPNFFPESELPEEQRAELRMEKWVEQQNQTSHHQMRKIGERLTEIEQRNRKLKEKNNELERKFSELEDG